MLHFLRSFCLVFLFLSSKFLFFSQTFSFCVFCVASLAHYWFQSRPSSLSSRCSLSNMNNMIESIVTFITETEGTITTCVKDSFFQRLSKEDHQSIDHLLAQRTLSLLYTRKILHRDSGVSLKRTETKVYRIPFWLHLMVEICILSDKQHTSA
jgi:hypothetical protein